MNQQGKLKRNKKTQENPTEYGMMEDMKKDRSNGEMPIKGQLREKTLQILGSILLDEIHAFNQ